MATALIGLGSNLGDRAAALDKAIGALKTEPLIRVAAVSSYRPSKPVGGPDGQGEFLNGAALLETSLPPEELLATLLRVEDQVGRIRTERWGPRAIDLDLLLYDRVEMKTPALELPHPRMCFRRFVLEPAAEIAPEMVWPVNGWSVAKLRDNLDFTTKYIAFSALKVDFEQVVNSVVRMTCRVVNTFVHPDAMLATAPADPSSAPVNWVETAILLQCKLIVEALTHLSPCSDESWILSEYWTEFEFDAAERLLRLQRRPSDSEMFDQLKNLRSLVPQPRLIVCLGNRDSSLASVQGRVEQLLRQVNAPPSLRLSMNDPRSARREVLAAMQAME